MARPEVSGQKFAYSVNEACALTNLGRDSIYAAVRKGQLRASKFGKRTIITEENLRSFLNSLPKLHEGKSAA